MLVLGSSIFLISLIWGIVWFVGFRKNSLIIEHLMDENKQLKLDKLKGEIDAQERERRIFGQDMHDELGSTLLTMKMNLGLIEKQGLFIFESNDALKELKYSLDSAIEYVKGVSRVTSPAFLENFGLSRAVLQMVKRINASCVAKVEFVETGEPVALDKEYELHIFRIIQEVVNNALRHGSPWQITVTFLYKPKSFMVEIQDDGYNYRHTEKFRSAGLGLNNIRNRASVMGAEFLHEDLEQGNLSRLILPLPTVVLKKPIT
jgi:signal transduction histidine kinase